MRRPNVSAFGVECHRKKKKTENSRGFWTFPPFARAASDAVHTIVVFNFVWINPWEQARCYSMKTTFLRPMMNHNKLSIPPHAHTNWNGILANIYLVRIKLPIFLLRIRYNTLNEHNSGYGTTENITSNCCEIIQLHKSFRFTVRPESTRESIDN